jgi:predicted ABC-type exoprotein transport system permease subunit
MNSVSWVHWLLVLIVVAIVIYPVALIVKKAGYSRWWALLALVPFVNWLALWAFALVRWPTEKKSDAQS